MYFACLILYSGFELKVATWMGMIIILILVKCIYLRAFGTGSIVDLFTEDESSERAIAIYRQKRLASLCIMSLYVNW